MLSKKLDYINKFLNYKIHNKCLYIESDEFINVKYVFGISKKTFVSFFDIENICLLVKTDYGNFFGVYHYNGKLLIHCNTNNLDYKVVRPSEKNLDKILIYGKKFFNEK